MDSKQKAKLKYIIFAATPSLILTGVAIWVFTIYKQHRDPVKRGKDLNQMAWEASFIERGLPIPFSGPREGYWGSRLNKGARHDQLGWHQTSIHIPDLLELDDQGFQYFSCDAENKYKLMILGGSVAFGAYASSIYKTYFNMLGRSLFENHGVPSDIVVVAAPAWKSIQELTALRMYGKVLNPDVIVFFNGLNDLTNGATSQALFGERMKPLDGSEWTPFYHVHDYEQRVIDYLANMKLAAEYTDRHGKDLLIVLQPSLVERINRTKIEEVLLEGSLKPHKSAKALSDSYESMRLGLRNLALINRIHFLDCSRVFNKEAATIFCDIWHFSDIGQSILSEIMAVKIKAIIDQRNKWPDKTKSLTSRYSFTHEK